MLSFLFLRYLRTITRRPRRKELGRTSSEIDVAAEMARIASKKQRTPKLRKAKSKQNERDADAAR